MAACIAFILYTRHETWSLVEEDYYPKELRHEEKLVKIRNAAALSRQLQVVQDKVNLNIIFPADFKGFDLKGVIDVYRPSDETLDVIIPVQTDTTLTQTIPLHRLKHGRYVVKVDWSSGGKDYFAEQDIFIP